MDLGASLRLARMIRFGRFPSAPTADDWARVSWVPAADRAFVLRAASEIAVADFDLENPPQAGQLSDLFTEGVGGPLGTKQATIDMAVTVTKPSGEEGFQRVRASVDWDIDWASLIDFIEALVDQALQDGDSPPPEGAGSWIVAPSDMFIW